MIFKIHLIFILLLFPIGALATVTVYVDGDITDCTNYNPSTELCSGGSDRAYDDPQEAIDWVNAQGHDGTDTVYIYFMDGTYNVPVGGGSSVQYGIWIRDLDGSATYPIYLQAYNITWSPSVTIQWNTGEISSWGGNPVLIHSGSGLKASNNYADNVHLVGMELIGRGTGSTNDAVGHASQDNVTEKPLYADRMKIHNFQYGAFRGGHQWIVEKSEIYDIGTTLNHHGLYITKEGATPNGSIIRWNYFHDIGGWAALGHDESGAYGDPSGLEFYGNIVTRTGNSLSGGGGFSTGGDDAKVYNNVLHNLRYGIRIEGSADNWFVQNNIILNPEYGGVYCENTNTGATITYNLIRCGHVDSCAQGEIAGQGNCTSSTISDNLTSDPQLTGVTDSDFDNDFSGMFSGTDTWTDYQLGGSSPAISAGTTSPGANYDDYFINSALVWVPTLLDQDSHGPGWEMGAFVFGERGSYTTEGISIQ
jgi:hypothetical protein